MESSWWRLINWLRSFVWGYQDTVLLSHWRTGGNLCLAMLRGTQQWPVMLVVMWCWKSNWRFVISKERTSVFIITLTSILSLEKVCSTWHINQFIIYIKIVYICNIIWCNFKEPWNYAIFFTWLGLKDSLVNESRRKRPTQVYLTYLWHKKYNQVKKCTQGGGFLNHP